MLSDVIKQTNVSNKNNSYKDFIVNGNSGYFSLKNLSDLPYSWKFTLVKMIYRNYKTISENLFLTLFDEEQWNRIVKYADKRGMKIVNPIKPSPKMTPRIFFDMMCNQVFEESLLMCLNMNVYFEHFEKKITEVLDTVIKQIAKTPPQDFLIGGNVFSSFIFPLTGSRTECRFSTRNDPMHIEIYYFIDDLVRIQATMIMRNKYIIKLIQEDLMEFGSDFSFYVNMGSGMLELPLDDYTLNELDEKYPRRDPTIVYLRTSDCLE